MKITIKKYTELSVHTRNELDSHIHFEFGHVPIVSTNEWAMPDWTVICYEEGEMASFCNIVERTVTLGESAMKAGGINNLITTKDFRGKGYASLAMLQAEKFMFEQLNCSIGLLLCSDELVPFYERRNWHLVDCLVYYKQTSGECIWSSNAMLLTEGELLAPEQINLNGLPW